jgi:hypothetical protein
MVAAPVDRAGGTVGQRSSSHVTFGRVERCPSSFPPTQEEKLRLSGSRQMPGPGHRGSSYPVSAGRLAAGRGRRTELALDDPVVVNAGTDQQLTRRSLPPMLTGM